MFEIDDQVLQRLQGLARVHETDVGALVRRAISADLARRDHPAPARAAGTAAVPGPKPEGEDGFLAQVSEDLKTAETWGDLRARLGKRGLVLRRRQGALVLTKKEGGEVLYDCAALGTTITDLVRRFGATPTQAPQGYLSALSVVAPSKA